MRVSSQLLADNVKRNLNKQTELLLKTQRKLVTGKKINKLSDDPIAMGRVLDYRQSLAKIGQYELNTNTGRNRAKLTETILDNISELVNTAKKIAGDPNMESPAVMADEISNIKAQILQLANSKINGNYMFSGNQTGTPPFTEDITGTVTYNGDSANKRYMVGDNVDVSMRADGEYIFQNVNDVFSVLDDLHTAILASDGVAIQNQVVPLHDISNHLKDVRAENASIHKRMELTETHWSSFKLEVQLQLSQEEDANLEAAALDMLALQNSYQIAIATSAKIIQPNLMQFLS
ncbi:MAG: flagellar hook-associated protein FlgL [Desulfobacteraceae bacterium]|nr:flagellar hook-associated protein FlgL [Desulfobacteraceae bacterium]